MKLLYPEVDYGPLLGLMGVWEGDKGMDISPEPDGTEENPYFETITIEEVGSLENAESQELSMVSYKQVVSRKRDNGVFHHQLGYWIYDAERMQVMYTLTIPRGLALLAGGTVSQEGDAFRFQVESQDESKDWGIAQSPFLRQFALTKGYTLDLTLDGDTMKYAQNTSLAIYGRDFAHTDENTLTRVK